ncbi:MAG: hypothetical protein C5B52_03510 [Bacteroidetes bacterium]|nr:MAG: hypothetical protein C5B52_03510 [Bacteroidota bacterium]
MHLNKCHINFLFRKTAFIVFFAIQFPFVNYSQSIVANGGFEDENTCTELKAKCAPEAWFIFSKDQRYIKSPNYAFNGNYFVSMIMLNRTEKAKRTFIESKLLCTLQAGHEYKIEMMVRAEKVEKELLNVILREQDMFLVRQWPEMLVDPSKIFSYSDVQAASKKGWNKVTFQFKADGRERWLIIGHLSEQENVASYKGYDGFGNLLYYIDDVTMSPVDPNEQICPDYEANKTALYEINERHSLFDEKMIRMKDSIYNPKRIAKPLPPPPKIDTLLLSDILFELDKSTLNPKFTSELDKMAEQIKAKSFNHLIIVGHTDSIGSDSYNQQLSENRATTIFNYLAQQKGFDPTLMEHRGEGEKRPVVSNSTETGRQRNRRVELILFRQD